MSSIISIQNRVVSESDGYVDIVVSLNAPSVDPVSVNWATGDGTAKYLSDVDYVRGSGTLTFAAGETVKTIRVAVTNDSPAEAVESFKINLTLPVNAVLGNSTALVTVVDNDATPASTPVVSVSDVIVDEAAGEAVFVISLDRPGTGLVTLNYATADGTALAGSDYTAQSGSLSFVAGEMVKTVRVASCSSSSPAWGRWRIWASRSSSRRAR